MPSAGKLVRSAYDPQRTFKYSSTEDMTPYQLGYWLKSIVADIVPVGGHLFVNRDGLVIDELADRVATYESPQEAQRWMNIVLLDDFISQICGDDWTDADANQVLEVFVLAWGYQVQAKYPKAVVQTEIVSDPEYGDLGVRLVGVIG